MQNQVKFANINKCHVEILQSINKHTLVNAYFGGSNLLSGYLNDYSSEGINTFVGEFIDGHWNKPYMREYPYSASELIENPDVIIEGASMEFFYTLGEVLVKADCETIFRNSKKSFNGYKSFYIFGEQVSNACCTYYIIRQDSFNEALNELITEFEKDFIIEDKEDVTGSTLYNDNGEPVNIDNLVFLGEIKLTE